MIKITYVSVICLGLSTLLVGCKGQPPRDQPHQLGEFIYDAEPNADSAAEYFPPAAGDYFYGIDGKVVNGEYKPLGAINWDDQAASACVKDAEGTTDQREAPHGPSNDAGDSNTSADNAEAGTNEYAKDEADEMYAKGGDGLTPLEIKGRNAWMLWTGGNEIFWDWLSKNSYGSNEFLKVIDSDKRHDRFQRGGFINEPGMRAPTAAETEAAHGIRYDRPDENYTYNGMKGGYQPDPKVYGEPTGILGMRIFDNPEFGAAAKNRWDAERFYSDPVYASNPSTIKPKIVGISCAICHVSFHPLNPPKDPENPKWENISSTVGAQYLRVREIFGNALEPESYLYHVMDSQFPGTIDTSLIPSDNINNANTMNAIYGLKSRVTRSLYNSMETLSDESYGLPGETYPGLWDAKIQYGSSDYPPPFAPHKDQFERNPRHVPRVLVDGSDSLGTWVALSRVYLNIGTYHQQWIRTHNTILGYRDQDPFTLKDCEENSIYWHATKLRVDSMTAYFLKATDQMLLKDAIINNEPVEKFPPTPAVKEYAKDRSDYKFSGLPTDPALMKARAVFAKGCIACHSSKQPDYGTKHNESVYGCDDSLVVRDKSNVERDPSGDIVTATTLTQDDLWRLTRGDGKLPSDYARWARWAVETPGFWDNNYLSIDERIPVTITETNSGRAMATNAKTGHVWEDFASNTYKDLPSVGKIRYRDPFSGATNEYNSPEGGPGYYRVPTLISAWSTAPFFHNNALGNYNNDPSVKGRLEAFDDAINKLLFPEKRLQQPHDLANLDASANRSPAELTQDGGLIWRTNRRTHLIIFGHQIPSFIYGYTGFTRFWVRVIPWLPSIALLFIGLALLMVKRLKRIKDKILGWLPQLRFLTMLGTTIGYVVLGAVGLFVGYVLYKYFMVIRLIEIGSGWYFPWATLQILAFVLLLVGGAFVLFFKSPRLAKYAGFACLLFAVLFALGFGRFGSGLGGDLKIGPFPKGMPVNLVVNLNRHADRGDLVAAGKALTTYFIEHREADEPQKDLHDFERDVAPALMKVSSCPDLVLDRGHDYEFIQHLTEEEKRELILLIKTF